MDWRVPIRRWIGGNDDLGPIKMAVLRLIDPVEAHMRSNFALHDSPTRTRGGRGWVAYAPTIDANVPEPRRAIERPNGGGLDEYLRVKGALLEAHEALFEARAKDLLAGRDVVIETTGGTVRARLTRYRNGAVFEDWRTAPGSEGNGVARIEPEVLDSPLLVDHLAQAVLNLGLDAQPRG